MCCCESHSTTRTPGDRVGVRAGYTGPMESVLVTGGAGFIGSNFVRFLLAHTDARVVVLDRLTYAGNLATLADVRSSPRLTFVQGDIGDRTAVEALLREHRPDAVVNLAAETHVDRSIDGPGPFVETNLVGTFELLDAARRHLDTLDPVRRGRFRFLHVSTDEVYGSLGPMGRFEETSPYAPNSPYAASKAGADHLVRAYCETYRLPALRHELLEQLRALPVPREADPPHDAQRGRGSAAAYLRRRGKRARLAPRRGSLRGAAPRPAARDARRSIQRGRGRRADEPRDRGWDLRGARGDPAGGRQSPRSPPAVSPGTRTSGRSSPIGQATTGDTRSTRPGSERSSVGARSIEFQDGLRATVAWYLAHRDWCDAVLGDRYGRERLGLGEGTR